MELRSFYVSKTEHKKRTEVHLKKGKQLKDSFEAMTKDEWNNICEINVFAKYPHNRAGYRDDCSQCCRAHTAEQEGHPHLFCAPGPPALLELPPRRCHPHK